MKIDQKWREDEFKNAKLFMTRPLSKKESNSGFTLLELIVVMALIGIISVFTIPMLSSFSKIEINTTLKEITAALRSARTLAVSKKTTHIFTLDIEKSLYFISAASALKSSESENVITENQYPTLRKELKKEILVEGFKKNLDGDIIKEALIEISFFPKGNSSGGVILLNTKDDPLVNTVTVEKISGRVKIGRLNEE